MPKQSKKPESNQQMIIDLIREISGQANLLTIPKIFITLTGDIKAALFLSQCIYWDDRSTLKDGWFYKSYEDWKEEIGLSHREIERIRKDLTDRNYLEFDIRQAPPQNAPTCFYKVNIENVYQTIQNIIPYRGKRDMDNDKRESPYRGKRDMDSDKRESPYRGKRDMDSDKSAISLNRILHNLPTEPTTEITSSSYPPPQKNQEVEVEVEVTQEIKISDSLISALEEIDVFESLYAEIIASGWTEEQLIEQVHRVKKSNCENPGAIFMWRLRNQKPPRTARTTPPDWAMLQEDLPECDQPEIPDEVYDAWEKTLSQLSLEMRPVDYKTWLEPVSIAGYNGHLILHAPNQTCFDELRKLKYGEIYLRNIFSKHLGQDIPVKFEVEK